MLTAHLSLSLEGSVPVEWLLQYLCKGAFFNMSDEPVAGVCLLHILNHLLLPLWPHQHLMSARLLTASLFTTTVLHLWPTEVFTLFLSWRSPYRYLLKQIIYHCSLEQRECVLGWKSSSLNPSHPCNYWLSLLKHYDMGCSLRSRKGGHRLGRYHKRCLYTVLG